MRFGISHPSRRCPGPGLFSLAAVFCFPLLGSAQADDIRSALDEVRNGRLTSVVNLRVNERDIPTIAPYLVDRSEDVRREAVVLLARIGSPACRALVKSLTDAAADIRERVARAVYRSCRFELSEIPGLETALRRSNEMGNAAAAPLVLLGHWPSEETRRYLREQLARETPPVKLDPWNPPVPQRIAAAVGGVSVGIAEARPVLEQGLTGLNEAEFIAMTVDDIQTPDGLRLALRLLQDQRPVAAGVPSGAEPRRRICDLAVDSYIRRLKLKPAFPTRPAGRSSGDEIARLQLMAQAAIDQM